MKLEISERLLVETLVDESIKKEVIDSGDYKIQKLTGDASTRRYYRIIFKDKAYVVCLDTPRNESDGEPDFVIVHRTLEKDNVRVPKILDCDIERGYYLEEDLGDQTFLKQLSLCRSRAEEKLWYVKAVDLLIEMHKVDISTDDQKVYCKRSFDQEKLMSEIQFTFTQFIEGLMNYKKEEYDQASLMTDFTDLCQKISSGPWVFTHRDYHSRNLMIKDEELIVIDFQDARKGLPQYDLCSLLEDCYYETAAENHDDLIKRYWNNFAKDLFHSEEEFMEQYRLMAVQRIFKAIGSFAYIYRLRGDIRYLRHIGRAFERLKDILFELGQYPNLRQQLASLYYAY
ncbi:MAG: hypothetical protein CME71_07500 [Halobacteriovorax sp.]|nr:hypothetical protein [Halobacteriovorax sp.]